jgi:hypothetical protein
VISRAGLAFITRHAEIHPDTLHDPCGPEFSLSVNDAAVVIIPEPKQQITSTIRFVSKSWTSSIDIHVALGIFIYGRNQQHDQHMVLFDSVYSTAF